MNTRFMLCCLLALPIVVVADANHGQFMGYELGAEYPSPPQEFEVTTAGDLLIEAENPTKPADIAQVTLVATPESRTIGYISAVSWHATEEEAREVGRRYAELLRAKYPNWKFGREVMDTRMHIVEVNLDNSPYNLQLRLVLEEHDGRDMWRFSMGLGWQRETIERKTWQSKAAAEHVATRATEHEKLMKEMDTRGL
ncbi:MAG: hypothetical protein ACR2Q3_12025 [Woeseiaceae bacterium]